MVIFFRSVELKVAEALMHFNACLGCFDGGYGHRILSDRNKPSSLLHPNCQSLLELHHSLCQSGAWGFDAVNAVALLVIIFHVSRLVGKGLHVI